MNFRNVKTCETKRTKKHKNDQMINKKQSVKASEK